MKKLKILVSAYACNPISSLQRHPGEDIAGWNLARQASRFNELWVITHSFNKEGINKILAQNSISGINFYFLNLPPWLRWLYEIEFGQRIYYYLWQILAWKEAKKLHQKFHFDLAHHITFNNDWIPSFIGAFLDIPFIWGPIGGGQKTPKSLMKEYSLYGRFAEKARNAAQWFGRNSYFRRRCLQNAKAVLVCNKDTKAKISEKYNEKISFFPVNGISSADLCPKTNNKNPNKTFRILSAGRLHPLKGFSLAIKVFKIFSIKAPESKFIIIGKGPEKSHLLRIIQDLGLESKAKIQEWLPREELLRMMRLSDVFIFPSFRDGGGAVVVEAMASGKPVVCLDIGGPGFHIKKQWGIKIAPKNPEYVIHEMARALEKLYLNKDLREKMGKAARKRAEEFYQWDRQGDQLQKIYKKVLAT